MRYVFIVGLLFLAGCSVWSEQYVLPEHENCTIVLNSDVVVDLPTEVEKGCCDVEGVCTFYSVTTRVSTYG